MKKLKLIKLLLAAGVFSFLAGSCATEQPQKEPAPQPEKPVEAAKPVERAVVEPEKPAPVAPKPVEVKKKREYVPMEK